MQGAAPLASPALDRLRHLQNLPSRCQAGGLLSLLPAYPAFSLLFCPLSPRPPSPVGKGEIKVIFMQGAAPLASPTLDRLRHLQSLPSRCPQGGCSPCGTCSPCPGGEDHLKRRRRLRRIVPSPPVPPLLGCRLCSPEPRPNRRAPPPGAANARRACNAGARPPPGTWFAPISQRRAGSGAGMQGAQPLA